MSTVLAIFVAVLAYAVLDRVRRRHRARRLRTAEAARRELAPRRRAPDPPPTWFEGARLDGGYRVGKLLGSGASGVVHIVESRALDRRWAAKVIRRDLVADPARRHALLRELAHGFRVAGHPHIVSTEMFRSFGDEIAIFSELVDGGTLAEALSSPRFAGLASVVEVALQLARALEAIHAAGLAHGDVKPNNVLLARTGEAKLADLGLALLLHAGDRRAAPGTPLYRSPEQASGGEVTAASDVWSWGVTVIAMLLGEPPSHAGGEIAAHTLSMLRGRGSRARVPLDDALYQILSRCLRKDPVQRITSTGLVDELSARLGRAETRRERPAAHVPPDGLVKIVDDLAAHSEGLRELLGRAPGGGRTVHDAALTFGMVKAECHRRHGDLAGAATTLERVLEATPAGARRLRVNAWLELGAAHHDRGAPAAARHAFDQAAAAIDDPWLRARAHHGAALAAWTANERETALARVRSAVMLAMHSIELASTDLAEARCLHTTALLTLAGMLRDMGDMDGHEACVAHAIAACDALDDLGRQTLVRGLILQRDFSGARACLRLLDGGLAAQRPEPKAATSSASVALLTAIVELEEARVLALDGQRSAAIERARRSRDLLRPLAERGVMVANLPLAVAEVHLAWLSRGSRELAPSSVERALATLDDAARSGRRDAAVLAGWVRAQRLVARPGQPGSSA